MAYDPLLTTDSFNAIELDCGTAVTGTFYTGTYVTGSYVTGTYYYVTSIIDVTIHSGSSFRISPNMTWADYRSQELAQDTENKKSVDVYAVEGEWKIVKQNENNLMVTDVAAFPIARNAQYIGADDNGTICHYEFPHHHMMPKELNGNVTLLKSGILSSYGMVTYRDYVFFSVPATVGGHIHIHRMDMRDSSESITPDTFPSVILNLYHIYELEFSVIDENTIMFVAEDVTETMGYFWATYNFSTGEFETKVWPYPYIYYGYIWHWAVIGKYLCLSQAKYKDVNGQSYYSFEGRIYDYTTGELKASYETANVHNWANLQYPRTNDLIIGKKYFATYYFNIGGGDDFPAGYDDYARMLVFDVENFTIEVVKLSYIPTIKGGSSGECSPFQMCYNPFNGMIYWIAYYSYKYDGTHYKWCNAVMIMSPDNYSHSPIYEYYWNNTTPYVPIDSSQVPAMLVPGMFELYCVMANGHVYNVRDMPNVGGTPTAYLPTYLWEAVPTEDWDDNKDMPQHDKCASCLDRWDRMWYIDGSYVVAVNFVTGDEEARIDAGIPNVWRWEDCYPFNTSFQHVYLARDRLLVYCNKKGTCLAHPDQTDYIIIVE